MKFEPWMAPILAFGVMWAVSAYKSHERKQEQARKDRLFQQQMAQYEESDETES